MSRVIYTDMPATADQEALRVAHRVRVVEDHEEGTGVNALPGGVYGFTYSPGLPNAPLFAVQRYRSYETHKLTSGDVFVVGYGTREVARQMSIASEELTIQIHPRPEQDHDTLVVIPYSRIRRHRQHAAPNQDGFTVTMLPG